MNGFIRYIVVTIIHIILLFLLAQLGHFVPNKELYGIIILSIFLSSYLLFQLYVIYKLGTKFLKSIFKGKFIVFYSFKNKDMNKSTILYILNYLIIIGSLITFITLPVFDNADFDDEEMIITFFVFIGGVVSLLILNIYYKSYFYLKFKRILLEMDKKKKEELVKIEKLSK